MKPTLKCVAMWGVALALWVFSFVVALWVAAPHLLNPWWVEFFRGPAWTAAVAAYTVSLVLHHLLGDRGTMFKIALQLGREEEREDALMRAPNVLPMQRRSSMTT